MPLQSPPLSPDRSVQSLHACLSVVWNTLLRPPGIVASPVGQGAVAAIGPLAKPLHRWVPYKYEYMKKHGSCHPSCHAYRYGSVLRTSCSITKVGWTLDSSPNPSLVQEDYHGVYWSLLRHVLPEKYNTVSVASLSDPAILGKAPAVAPWTSKSESPSNIPNFLLSSRANPP